MWKINKFKAIKYSLYCFFWISAFVWVLFMDATLYHLVIVFKNGLIISLIVCLALAVLIFGLSVLEKSKEGDAFYIRHQNWQYWWYSNNCECNNNIEKSAQNFAKPGHLGTTNAANANQAAFAYHGAPINKPGPTGHLITATVNSHPNPLTTVPIAEPHHTGINPVA